MEILLKRAYEKPTRSDGVRVLVDRLWPRGVKKADLHLHAWTKDIAPSTELRQWFAHDEARWPEFRKRYKHELANAETRRIIKGIIAEAEGRPAITLVYGARDTKHNEAVVLREKFKRLITPAR
jgi:uncharacterized protein YeaO (DUF488 family)